MHEIIVDNFAGGGGTSTGIEMATGRSVDIAINHDPDAIAMHRANHPGTKHYCESVWEVDPREAAAGRPIGLCWLSPDCKHFSKAKGGKPVDKSIRGLAWVAVRWAATVKPRVIILENVEEFKTWGPILESGRPDPKQKGRTFNSFCNALRRLGYQVDYKELRACDFGAPTIRKRFFLIARCDGKPIVWPEPTRGDPDSQMVRSGALKPWRTAAEIIDWSIPCPSIFERKKPLSENTLRRIARGIQKFVIENPEPFIVKCNHTTSKGTYDCFRGQSIHEPMQTITAKHGYAVVTPFLIQYHNYDDTARGQNLEKPILTVDTSNRYGLVAAFLAKHYGGNYKGAGAGMDESVPTVTTVDHNALAVAHLTKFQQNSIGQVPTEPIHTVMAGATRFGLVSSHIVKLKGTNIGHKTDEPLHTITSGGLHFGEVRAFLLKYYGADIGQTCHNPLHTVTLKDRFGLVTVQGEEYQIADIGMRMLQPRELFDAQGFPHDYIIDRDADGKPYPKSAQVARCGNSVCPPVVAVLVKANLPELCAQDEDVERTG